MLTGGTGVLYSSPFGYADVYRLYITPSREGNVICTIHGVRRTTDRRLLLGGLIVSADDRDSVLLFNDSTKHSLLFRFFSDDGKSNDHTTTCGKTGEIEDAIELNQGCHIRRFFATSKGRVYEYQLVCGKLHQQQDFVVATGPYHVCCSFLDILNSVYLIIAFPNDGTIISVNVDTKHVQRIYTKPEIEMGGGRKRSNFNDVFIDQYNRTIIVDTKLNGLFLTTSLSLPLFMCPFI